MLMMPTTERAKLMALQERHRQLLAMLPADVDDIDIDDLDNQLASWELISTEMIAVTEAQLAILNGLGEA